MNDQNNSKISHETKRVTSIFLTLKKLLTTNRFYGILSRMNKQQVIV